MNLGFNFVVNAIANNSLQKAEEILTREMIMGRLRISSTKPYGFPLVTAADHFARINNQKAVYLLLRLGAHIDGAARGAAFAGNIEFVQKLLELGADNQAVVCGYACGGHMNYAREYITDANYMESLGLGAAIGGHVEFCRELHQLGADVDILFMGAIFSESFSYARELYKLGCVKQFDSVARHIVSYGSFRQARELYELGAQINSIVDVVVRGARLKTNLDVLEFLTLFKPETIKEVQVNKLKAYPLLINECLLKNAHKISTLMTQHNLNFMQVFVSIYPVFDFMRYMLLSMKKKGITSETQTLPDLPNEIWLLILSSLTSLTQGEMSQLSDHLNTELQKKNRCLPIRRNKIRYLIQSSLLVIRDGVRKHLSLAPQLLKNKPKN